MGVPRPIRRSRVVHSWTIGVVLIGATVYGLWRVRRTGVSAGVRETLPDVLRGQDLLTLTLATVPVLVWAAVRARGGSLGAHLLWAHLLWAGLLLLRVLVPDVRVRAVHRRVPVVRRCDRDVVLRTARRVMRLRMDVVSAALDRAPRRPAKVFLIIVAVLFIGM
jgi:hypothetical protein